MPKNQNKYDLSNRKRLVLVAEDEAINRDLLEMILMDEYSVLTAADGTEALRMIRENGKDLSIILLDLMMPGMTGLELLDVLRQEPDLQNIPVIVLTSDQDSEIQSLELGAADFIPKPYPQPGVILARVRRTIELFEDRQTIRTTERDPLTNLYNREYFYHYSELYDQHHRDTAMDAIVLDVRHFHIINERFGNTFGDRILSRIGETLEQLTAEYGGIACRKFADTFMIYCPHGIDYSEFLEKASITYSGEDPSDNRIRLRMGVYPEADKSLPIEQRFDRANMAAETIRSNFTGSVEFYNEDLHEKELFGEQLVEDFRTAIRDKQFKVYYQPKYDVRGDKPFLAGGEALVRWIHPKYGFISPGTFIPLFENNGLIQELDHYVWQTAAEQIHQWKTGLGFSVPVSVNVSRADMYDPDLVGKFDEILEKYELKPSDLNLEVTESAYTRDSGQIINTVNRLRGRGFRIEMDDFGTGYSSLNMLSQLPIDILKLDMFFIRNAFSHKKDTRLLEIMIDIGEYLAVPVIAEGVETEEQMKALKAIGCSVVQGYYFSKPVPASEFEPFIRERIMIGTGPAAVSHSSIPSERQGDMLERIVNALSSGFETIYDIDLSSDRYTVFSSDDCFESLRIVKTGSDFFADAQALIAKRIYLPDQAQVQMSLNKERLVSHLNGSLPFSMTYRVQSEDLPLYYNLKAVRSRSHDRNHVVIGVSNVDEQMRREEEQAIAALKALRDELTGVKSLYALRTEEEKLNRDIDEGIAEQFAVAVCDINDMAHVNRTHGREEGNEYLKEACRVICRIFTHSPVFRTGGDEFAVILHNNDYKNRNDLFKAVMNENLDGDRQRKVMIACGIADFRPGADNAFNDVFARAENAMKENKELMKQSGQTEKGD